MTTAHSPAQSKCARGRVWVIVKLVVGGCALELVDASDDKVTREGVISRKKGKKGHVNMVAAQYEMGNKIMLNVTYQGEGWEQLGVKARAM